MLGCGSPTPELTTTYQDLGVVDKEGGEVCSKAGLCVKVPAGLVQDGQTVKLSAREVQTTTTTKGIVGKVFELKAEYSNTSQKANTFTQPVVLTLPLPSTSGGGKEFGMATFKETPKGRGGIWSRVAGRGGIWSRDPKNAGRGGIWSSVPAVTDGKNISANARSFSMWTVVELCPEGQTRCFGTCVKDDKPTRCCDDKTACPTGGTCTNNRCTCPANQIICEDDKGNDACVDTQSSASNCGACGKACASGESCVKGACIKSDCVGDKDKDGTPDCQDQCPDDKNKTEPGQCGCGKSERDGDRDGTPDCNDKCSEDPRKTQPGQCGCNVPDVDNDKDGTIDCKDKCPYDKNKVEPGKCGCNVADTDTDKDGTPDCNDKCPYDKSKTEPGKCGCGNGTDSGDSDKDGLLNCVDPRPNVGCSCFSLSDLTKVLSDKKYKCTVDDQTALQMTQEVLSGTYTPVSKGLVDVLGVTKRGQIEPIWYCLKGCTGTNPDLCVKQGKKVGRYTRISLVDYYACQDVVRAACKAHPSQVPTP